MWEGFDGSKIRKTSIERLFLGSMEQVVSIMAIVWRVSRILSKH